MLRRFGARALGRRAAVGSRIPDLPFCAIVRRASHAAPDVCAIVQTAGALDYYNPATWPPTWTAADIKNALESRLKDPSKVPNYEVLAFALQMKDFDSILSLLKEVVKPPPPKEVDVEKELNDFLASPASAPLQERDAAVNAVCGGLVKQPSSSKRTVVYSYSPRGSGKTQFIKFFVATKRRDAMKCGRVIVRCCDRASTYMQKWVQLCMEGNDAEAFCELIREHVERVTHNAQSKANYANPAMAYKTWIHETERFYNIAKDAQDVEPLIILDTCEILANVLHPNSSLVHTSNNMRYTLLEAFCFRVPSPYGIFVIGCNAAIASDALTLTRANVVAIGPLKPLSEEGHKMAVQHSWRMKIDDRVRIPLYHWAGGLPRLLRNAHEVITGPVSLACGSLNAFSDCFEKYRTSAHGKYPISKEWFPYAYTCLLASSTKATVEAAESISVNPQWLVAGRKTYDDAMKQSIGTFDADRGTFTMPPITFTDDVVATTISSVQGAIPIMPSQLHPFLDSGVAEYLGKNSTLDRGHHFEKPFMYAMYARYLLEYWKNPKNKWVPFTMVFQGALLPAQEKLLQEYEVNLSEGVKIDASRYKEYTDAEKYALTYLGGTCHHDAYIWCRHKGKPQAEFAVPLQLRHGTKKTPGQLKDQLRVTQDESSEKVKMLLSVNNEKVERLVKGHENDIVMINADAMSSLSWLWLIGPKKGA